MWSTKHGSLQHNRTEFVTSFFHLFFLSFFSCTSHGTGGSKGTFYYKHTSVTETDFIRTECKMVKSEVLISLYPVEGENSVVAENVVHTERKPLVACCLWYVSETSKTKVFFFSFSKRSNNPTTGSPTGRSGSSSFTDDLWATLTIETFPGRFQTVHRFRLNKVYRNLSVWFFLIALHRNANAGERPCSLQIVEHFHPIDHGPHTTSYPIIPSSPLITDPIQLLIL